MFERTSFVVLPRFVRESCHFWGFIALNQNFRAQLGSQSTLFAQLLSGSEWFLSRPSSWHQDFCFLFSLQMYPQSLENCLRNVIHNANWYGQQSVAFLPETSFRFTIDGSQHCLLLVSPWITDPLKLRMITQRTCQLCWIFQLLIVNRISLPRTQEPKKKKKKTHTHHGATPAKRRCAQKLAPVRIDAVVLWS